MCVRVIMYYCVCLYIHVYTVSVEIFVIFIGTWLTTKITQLHKGISRQPYGQVNCQSAVVHWLFEMKGCHDVMHVFYKERSCSSVTRHDATAITIFLYTTANG